MKTKPSKLMSGKSKSGRIMLSCLLIATVVMMLVIPQTAQTASFAATEIEDVDSFSPEVIPRNTDGTYTTNENDPHPAGPTLAQSNKVGYAGHEWVLIGYNGDGVASSANRATLLLASDDGAKPVDSQFHSGSNVYTSSTLRSAYNALIGSSSSSFIDTSNTLLAKEATLIEARDLIGGSGNFECTSFGDMTKSSSFSDITAGISNADQYVGYIGYYIPVDATFDWFAYDVYRQTNPIGYSYSASTNFHPDHVAGTGLTGVDAQKLWPLSFAEASLLDSTIRMYNSTSYYWWLRSPFDGSSFVGMVDSTNGRVAGGTSVSSPNAVRPALNLNLTNVKFTSVASGANSKASLVAGSFADATAPATGDKIKFTVEDSSQSKPNVTMTSPTTLTNLDTLDLDYSGATTGASNQYLSAVLKDSNDNDKVVYYTKLASTLSSGIGNVSVSVAGIPDGNYTLEVFSEQINGENNTDFCSDVQTFSIAVDNIPPTLSNESATRTNTSDATVKFTSDEPGTYYYQIDGTPPTATSLATSEPNAATLIAGEQTINLSALTSGTHKIYIIAKDAAGHASNMLTINIPQETIFNVTEDFGTHVLGSGKDAVAKIDYDKYEDMIGLFCDGKEISKEYYKVSSGSTVITLDAAYLNRFKVGTYEFVAEFKDGRSESITLKIAGAGSGSPGTGDVTNIAVIAGLALLCLCVVQVTMVIKMCRRKARA